MQVLNQLVRLYRNMSEPRVYETYVTNNGHFVGIIY
jgi:hypothetical protein